MLPQNTLLTKDSPGISGLPLGLPPIQFLVYGYLTVLIVGFALLNLPIAQRTEIASLDHLFTATSALSTTGLATVSVEHDYSLLGEIIVLLLIQIGGLGYMSMGSFVVLLRKRELSNRSSTLLAHDFSLPQGFDLQRFTRQLVVYSLSVELVGAACLYWVFAEAGTENPLWAAIFHSISAFCTAGFSTFDTGLEAFRDNFWLNLVISVLSLLGALGFIVAVDFFARIGPERRPLTYTSRIILRFTGLSLLAGTVILYHADAGISGLEPESGILAAWFQSMSAMTTVGFNTVPIGGLGSAATWLVMLLMVVGASPSGTGGGLKSTTFTALWAQLKSTLRGRERATHMGRIIPGHRMRLAVSKFFFYVLVVCIGTFLLLLLEGGDDPFVVFFEALSALGTVGLSAGLTGALSPLGKLVVCALMFLGRIGPLSAGLALFGDEGLDLVPEEEDLAV